jgi:hypothetical protein
MLKNGERVYEIMPIGAIRHKGLKMRDERTLAQVAGCLRAARHERLER